MSDEYTNQIPNNVASQLTRPTIFWRVTALVMLLAAAVLLGNLLFGSSTAQSARPSYLKDAAVLASGVIQPHAQVRSNYRIYPSIEITDIVPMTMPEAYLGVGSDLARIRSNDPSMRLQNFWLSMHSPGTPKEYGDPFSVKWDQTGGGCNCWPVGGAFQPDYDGQGYDYALYVPNGSNGYLQIYDAAYQPKPGLPGQENFIFNQSHPCSDPNAPPSSCSTGDVQDYNRISQRWCASNATETGDNEPGAPLGQCDTQAMSATTVYSLYYPDSTPYYFGDDVLASSWIVPASPITGTNDGIHIVPSYAYSQTWTNFADAPNPGYLITPTNGYNIWRLNANVPFDGDHTITGTVAQNNYAVRLKTNYAGVQVFPSRRLPILATVNAGVSDFYLSLVPVSQAGRTLVVSLFDPGDANGTNYMQLLAPPDANHSQPYPVFFDAYVHDKYYPPGPDIVYLNTDRLDTTRPQHDTNDKWVDIVYHIPNDGSFLGGYFQIQYVFQGQAEDRTTWWMSISDGYTPFATPTYTPSPSSTPAPTNTPTNTPGGPTDTPTDTATATSTNTPTNTPAPPTNTPNTTLTPGCDGWSEQAPYPIAMNGSAVVSLNGYLYSFGGLTDFTPVANAYKYDGTSWTRIADLPGLRSDARAVTDGTYIYIINGDIPGNVSNALIRYNPASDSYTTLAAPAIATDAQAAAYLNGKIYRIGGNTHNQGNPYTSTVEVYTISANTWARAANYPTTIGLEMAVAFNGYIYTAGGADGGSNSGKKTYRYDPNADTWDDAAITDLPLARGLAASDIFAGKWLLAGGGNLYYDNTAVAWDPASNTWNSIASMVQPRIYLNGATLGSAFYAIGGFHGQPPNDISNDNQRYTSNCMTPTVTPPPTDTPTTISTSTPTDTPAPPTDTPINTPAPPTNTPMPSTTTTGTPILPTSTPTNTPAPPTSTPGGPSSTPTPTPGADSTPLPTSTPLPASVTPTITPTDCANPFVDIGGDIFYDAIHYLNCRGVINGTDATHYSPAGTATRGQFAKIVVLGFGLPFYTPGTPDFSDVPPTYFAYLYIESGYHAAILRGFDAASCTAHGVAYPCYLPNLAITRGQLTKLVVNAAHYLLYTPRSGPDFSDVPPSNVFYASIETAYHMGIIAGYADHTFRPSNNIRRDEMAQIVFKGVTTP